MRSRSVKAPRPDRPGSPFFSNPSNARRILLHSFSQKRLRHFDSIPARGALLFTKIFTIPAASVSAGVSDRLSDLWNLAQSIEADHSIILPGAGSRRRPNDPNPGQAGYHSKPGEILLLAFSQKGLPSICRAIKGVGFEDLLRNAATGAPVRRTPRWRQ